MWSSVIFASSTGVSPFGAQVLARQSLSDRPDSSMKTITRPCRAAIFLAQATSWPSRRVSPVRRARAPGRSAAARSNRAARAAATLRRAPSRPRISPRSIAQTAATSTVPSKIRPPATLPSATAPAPHAAIRTAAPGARSARLDARSASSPPCWRSLSQRITVWRETPTCRATSACGCPATSSLAPRRRSSSLRFSTCFIITPNVIIPGTWTARSGKVSLTYAFLNRSLCVQVNRASLRSSCWQPSSSNTGGDPSRTSQGDRRATIGLVEAPRTWRYFPIRPAFSTFAVRPDHPDDPEDH